MRTQTQTKVAIQSRLCGIVYYCGVWLGVAWCGGGYVGLQEAFHHLAASSPPPPPRRTYPYFWERTEYSTENYFLRQKIFCRRGHQSRRPPGTRRLNSIKHKWRRVVKDLSTAPILQFARRIYWMQSRESGVTLLYFWCNPRLKRRISSNPGPANPTQGRGSHASVRLCLWIVNRPQTPAVSIFLQIVRIFHE